jgi:hypothetical protein
VECINCQSELLYPLATYADEQDNIVTTYRCFHCGANVVTTQVNPKYVQPLPEGLTLNYCFAATHYSCRFKGVAGEPIEKNIKEYVES